MRRRAILREAILKSCASTEERLLGENTHLSDPIRGRESRSRSICSLTRLIGGGGNAALTKESERKRGPLFPSPSSPWTEASLSTVSIVSTASLETVTYLPADRRRCWSQLESPCPVLALERSSAR